MKKFYSICLSLILSFSVILTPVFAFAANMIDDNLVNCRQPYQWNGKSCTQFCVENVSGSYSTIKDDENRCFYAKFILTDLNGYSTSQTKNANITLIIDNGDSTCFLTYCDAKVSVSDNNFVKYVKGDGEFNSVDNDGQNQLYGNVYFGAQFSENKVYNVSAYYSCGDTGACLFKNICVHLSKPTTVKEKSSGNKSTKANSNDKSNKTAKETTTKFCGTIKQSADSKNNYNSGYDSSQKFDADIDDYYETQENESDVADSNSIVSLDKMLSSAMSPTAVAGLCASSVLGSLGLALIIYGTIINKKKAHKKDLNLLSQNKDSAKESDNDE